jgi:hypothetical protein
MDPHEELEQLLDEAIDSVKTTVLTLEAAAPLLGQRHAMFQGEATRLIADLRRIEGDVIALLDARDVDPAFEALMHTAATEVVACAICARTIQPGDRYVPTVTGGVVHIACADQLAARAQARRRRWALIHGGIFVCIVIAIGRIAGITPWLLAFTTVGLVLHMLLHRRWWYYLRRDVGRWLLLGARQ